MRNVSTNVGRPARALVIDPPVLGSAPEEVNAVLPTAFEGSQGSCFSYHVLSFSSEAVVQNDVAFLSPRLAFNLGLQFSYLHYLAYFNRQQADENAVHMPPYSAPVVEIQPLSGLCDKSPTEQDRRTFFADKTEDSHAGNRLVPFKHASHMRIGHVREPVLAGLSATNDDTAGHLKDRQTEVDAALHSYFKCDRIFSRGDVFAVPIAPQRPLLGFDSDQVGDSMTSEVVYFKVFPSAEPVHSGLCPVCSWCCR